MKKQILISLFIALTFLLVSCNTIETDIGEAIQTNTETKNEESLQTDTKIVETPSIVSESVETAFPGYPAPTSFRLPLCSFAIVEICEFLPLPNSLERDEYTGVAVNVIKAFDNSFNVYHNQDRYLRMAFLYDDIRDSISENYDDVILVPTSNVNDLSWGSTVFVHLDRDFLSANSFNLIDTSFYRISTVTVISEESDDGYEDILSSIPIIDNKLSIPEKILKNDYSLYGYGNVLMLAFGEANENLIKLGLDDLLFSDGMTIDELEEYFNLVTDENTFAPLFE